MTWAAVERARAAVVEAVETCEESLAVIAEAEQARDRARVLLAAARAERVGDDQDQVDQGERG